MLLNQSVELVHLTVN